MSDARDAARYRYLQAHWDDFTGYVSKNPGEWLDNTIDAALGHTPEDAFAAGFDAGKACTNSAVTCSHRLGLIKDSLQEAQKAATHMLAVTVGESYAFWQLRYDEATAALDALESLTPSAKAPSAVTFTLDDAIAAVDAEPELPGDMPDEMWQEILAMVGRCDRDAMIEAFRITVRQTKSGIRERLSSHVPSATASEYICKCGVRVEPHRCKTDGGF